MSELNKKKNITFVVVTIYLVLAVMFTAFSIFFYKINGVSIFKFFSKKETQPIVEKVIQNETAPGKNNYTNIKKVKLSDTYKLNNLEENFLSYEYGGFYDMEGNYQNKIEIEYSQISGLKDKEIQKKINKKIEETCKKFILPGEEEDDEIRHINIDTFISGNFSNMLSIEINKYTEYNDFEKESQYDVETLNFRLDTGEQICFEELFTLDASLKSIIAQSAYNSVCKTVNMEYYDRIDIIDIDNEDSEVNYSTVENTVYKILNEFNKSKERKFYFSYSSIYLLTSFENIEISMIDFYEYINIFNIVTPSKTLYENGESDSDIYVFGRDFSKGFEFEGEISNYIYLTVYNNEKDYLADGAVGIGDEKSNIFKENMDMLKDFLVKYEKSLNNDEGVFYNINEWYYDENNRIIFNCERREIGKKNFEENVEKTFQEASRINIYAELIFTINTLDGTGEFNIIDKGGEFEVEMYEDYVSEEDSEI